jgi:hypothetical protein
MGLAKDIHVVAEVKRVGNSLAIFIPAEKAREAGLTEGERVHADIVKDVPEPFGLLKHLNYEPFDRKKDMGYRDRI